MKRPRSKKENVGFLCLHFTVLTHTDEGGVGWGGGWAGRIPPPLKALSELIGVFTFNPLVFRFHFQF